MAPQENAHLIIPSPPTIAEYRVVVCGADEQWTGRAKLIEKYGEDSGGGKQNTKVFHIHGRPTSIELCNVAPGWCYGPLLDHHIHYSRAFAFVANPDVPESLAAIEKMHELVYHAARAHGLLAPTAGKENRIPIVLIGHVHSTSVLKGGLTAAAGSSRPGSDVLLALAESWECDYWELDSSNQDGTAITEVIEAFAETFVNPSRVAQPGVRYQSPDPPRQLRLRRILGHMHFFKSSA